MGDFDAAFVRNVKVQSWSLYSVCMLAIVLRLLAKVKRLGVLEKDDYVMIFAGGLYTTLIVSLNAICQGGGSNLYPPELAGTFTDEEVRDRIHGSKIVVVSEQAMLNVIYAIKVCMLMLYTRLTLGLRTQWMVRYLAWYVGVGWVATEIAFFTACRPFQGYWAMPPPDPQCTTLQHYSIVQASFNITSDLLMLFIPIPLILKVNVPWRQKAMLLVIFSLGVFVIVAALLTKIFNLSDVWDPNYMLWYMREASVAIYVSNIPLIWPVMRDCFPCLRYLTPSDDRPSANGPGVPDESSLYRRKVGISSTGLTGFTDSSLHHSLNFTRSATGKSARSGRRGLFRSRRAESTELTAFDVEVAFRGSSTTVIGSQQAAQQVGEDACSSSEHIVPYDPTSPGAGMPGSGKTIIVLSLDTRDGSSPVSAGGGGGGCGIHVERTVEVRAEDRRRSPSIVAMDREKGGASIYTWERSGVSKHCADARAERQKR